MDASSSNVEAVDSSSISTACSSVSDPGDERNIPGASLSGRKPESLTKVELIRWLRCREGASVSGNKSDLVQRVKQYISNGWDKKYLIIPNKVYGGTEHTAAEGFAQSMLDNPPPAGYTNCLDKIPKIEDGHIYQYFLVKCDGTKSTAQKHRDKGWNFYKSGKVKSTEFKTDMDDEVMMIRGNVNASFDRGFIKGNASKKNYDVYVAINKFTGDILGGRCKCKAGLQGFCNHVAAILFQIMDSQRMGDRFTPQPASQTSKLQTWHQPTVPGKACIKFVDLPLETFCYDKDVLSQSAKRQKVNYNSAMTCPDGENCVSRDRIEKFAVELKSLGTARGFVDILNGNNYKPCQANKMRKSSIDVTVHPSTPMGGSDVSCHTVTELKGYELSDAQIEYYNREVNITTIEQQQAISDKTIGQATNAAWTVERKKRITASKFHEVSHRRKFPADNLLERLTNSKPARGTSHMKWGRDAEPVALAQYKTVKQQKGYTVIGRSMGLIVNPACPYLGASPDWFVTLVDDEGKKSHGLVEVKAPSKLSQLTPEEVSLTGDSFFEKVDGTISVKTQYNPYFFQIQGQLNICGVEWCDLDPNWH